MALCEHFIYTAGIIDNQSGYQIISKSSGINNKIISELDNYLYPLGVNLSEFLMSKSLLVLNEHVVFTKIRNVGIGFDGRPDTLYSHTIIMKKKDFKKFSNDSRIFDDEYVEETQPIRMSSILIKEKKLLPDFTCVDELGISTIEKIFRGLLDKKKILLIDNDSSELIQSILSLMPSSMKIVSYSTNVAEPKRQSKYNMIQIKKKNLIKFPNSVKIDKKMDLKKIEKNDSLLNFCIKYILDIIDLKESKKLIEINHRIESIMGTITEKIILGTSLLIIIEKSQKFPKQHILGLKKMLREISVKQNEIINEFDHKLDELLIKQKSGEFEIENIISKFNDKKLNITILGKMFGELTGDNTGLRNSLFHHLVKKRIFDFEENGQDILLESINRYYNNEIIRGFVEESELHFAFKKIFQNNEINEYQKINLFSKAIKNALCFNMEFLENLFKFNVYDLKNYDHIIQFNKDIKWVFNSKEFYQNFNSTKILKILINIQEKVIPLFPKNIKTETNDPKFCQMEEILNILLNTARYMLTRKKYSLGSSKNDIILFENILSEFLSKNSLQNTKYDLLNPDLTCRVSSIFSWMLFLCLPYRCNNCITLDQS